MLRMIILMLMFLLIQCGIPSDEEFSLLNTPMALSIAATNAGDSTKLIITFLAYNPESNFTGYHIFVSHLNETDTKSGYTNMVSNNAINESIRYNYVVKSSRADYPTITDADGVGVDTARSIWTAITYEISILPDGSSVNTAFTYYIGVAAYSLSYNIQSGLSNIIPIQHNSTP